VTALPHRTVRKPIALAAAFELYASLSIHDPGFCIQYTEGTIRLGGMCMEGVTMKRALFWGTLVAGGVAAYMMYRRGESLGVIAAHTVTNPVGSLVTELKTASS
jgi:hypothetical protein